MKKFWKGLGIALLYFIVFLMVQVWVSVLGVIIVMGGMVAENGIGLFADADRFLRLYTQTMGSGLTTIILVSNLLTILTFYLFFTLRHQNFLGVIHLQKTRWQNLVLAVFYGFGMCFLVDLVTAFLPVPEDMMAQFELEHSMLWNGSAWITFLSVAIVGPISEEICFRGLCYTSLRKGMKPIWAGLLSAVLFGIAHGNPIWFLVGMLAGIALAWIYERTGSLWCCMIVHVVNNTIAHVTSMMPLSDEVGYGLIAAAAVVFPVCVYFLCKVNPRLRPLPVSVPEQPVPQSMWKQPAPGELPETAEELPESHM